MNKVIHIGNMASDPELKTTPSGTPVVSFRLAVKRKYADENGQYKADFFTYVAWKKTAEFICRNFKKGQAMLVEGELQNREYTDKNGEKRTATEILVNDVEFVGKKPEQENSNAPYVQAPSQTNTPYVQNNITLTEMTADDDLPF